VGVEWPVSVEQTDVVDILSVDRETGHVVLTISDHLDWSDSVGHQTILQKKLNTYLAFVESGEILGQYPEAKDRPVAFRVVFQVPPDESGRAFVARAREAIESAGITLRDEVFTGGRFN
jgi:hypothetical protein